MFARFFRVSSRGTVVFYTLGLLPQPRMLRCVFLFGAFLNGFYCGKSPWSQRPVGRISFGSLFPSSFNKQMMLVAKLKVCSDSPTCPKHDWRVLASQPSTVNSNPCMCMYILGGGFKYVFNTHTWGRWSNLTSIYFRWVETTNYNLSIDYIL